MFEPILACSVPAMFAVSMAATAISTVVAYSGQRSAAKAQREFQEANRKANNEGMILEARSANIKAAQEKRASAQQGEAIRRQAMGAKSDAQTAMSESGATGLTFVQAMSNFDQQESSLKHALAEEQSMREGSHNRYLDHLYQSTLQANIAGAQPVQSPSALGAISGFVGEAMPQVYEYGKDRGWKMFDKKGDV